MGPGVGNVLRLIGPVIEIACIAMLFQYRGRGHRVLGLPLEWLLYVGIGLGFVLVVVGLILSRRVRAPRDRWDVHRQV